MLIALTIIITGRIIFFIYMRQPVFGKMPAGKHLEKIKKSPNFKKGKFQNTNYTPQLTEGAHAPKVMYEFFFKKSKRGTPKNIVPSVITDLLNLPINKDVLVWFGHSSYYLQIDGKRFLVDPVLSGSASPISSLN